MVDFNIKKSKKTSSKTVKPGEYRSDVREVEWAKGYVKGKAISIKYELTSETGEVFEYSEIFFNDDQNDRTAEFFDYLAANGVDDINDFVGCSEQLTLLKDVRGNRSQIRITDREFLGKAEETTDVGVQG